MSCDSNQDKLFRIAGISGLSLLLIFFIYANNRKKDVETSSSSDTEMMKMEHDHADPESHGNDVTTKTLEVKDNSLKESGTLKNGKRVVAYRASKYKFSPDPLVVRRGETVILQLTSTDVAHGVMIPAIDFDSSMPVKKVLEKSFKAPDKPGKYPIFCSTYCGAEHGNMQGTLIVLPEK